MTLETFEPAFSPSTGSSASSTIPTSIVEFGDTFQVISTGSSSITQTETWTWNILQKDDYNDVIEFLNDNIGKLFEYQPLWHDSVQTYTEIPGTRNTSFNYLVPAVEFTVQVRRR